MLIIGGLKPQWVNEEVRTKNVLRLKKPFVQFGAKWQENNANCVGQFLPEIQLLGIEFPND